MWGLGGRWEQGNVNMNSVLSEAGRETWDPLLLMFQILVSCPKWGLGTELTAELPPQPPATFYDGS